MRRTVHVYVLAVRRDGSWWVVENDEHRPLAFYRREDAEACADDRGIGRADRHVYCSTIDLPEE